MKILSLDWFKSKIEIGTDRAIEKVVTSKLEQLMEQEIAPSCFKIKNVKLVNNVLTVVTEDGQIFTKIGATEEDYDNVLNSNSVEDVLNVIATKEVIFDREKENKEKIRISALSKGLELLKDNPDFIIKDGTVELAGTGRTLPTLLLEKFIEVVYRVSHEIIGGRTFHQALNEDEEYISLKRFFMWCALNPRAEVANELYRFLTENSFKITKQGFFVALRNVVTLHGSPELVHFISNAYNKVKAVWKKNPSEYTVFLENGEYKIVHDDKLSKEETFTSTTCPECEGEGQFYNDWDEEWTEECENCNGTGEVDEYEYTITVPVNHGEKIGKLTDLYLDLPNRAENRFTDDWTKTFDIRIGKVVNMPKEDCNWSTQDCMAAGLHFTADQIHYVGCGDQSVIVLINPMKVVGIGQHKGRCYEYLPIMTVPREEATSILHDDKFDTLQLDEDYAIRELENLQEKVKEGFTVESKKHSFNLPSISSENISLIVSSLSEMKNEIKNRVVKLD